MPDIDMLLAEKSQEEYEKYIDNALSMENLDDLTAETLVNKLIKSYKDQLEEYLKGNLAALGYTFDSTEDWFNFVKQRITRAEFEDVKDYYEYYLDYDIDSKSGTLIGTHTLPRFETSFHK